MLDFMFDILKYILQKKIIFASFWRHFVEKRDVIEKKVN